MKCDTCGHDNPPTVALCESCGALVFKDELDWAPAAFSEIDLLESQVANRRSDTVPEVALESTELDLDDSGFFERPLLRPFHDALSEYTILRHLGEGGQGKVYLANQQHLQRRVAIKVVTANEHPDSVRLIERLKREAWALASLDHPCVIPLYDMFESEGRLCIVMGFAEGGSVEDLLDRQRRLPEREAAAIVRQAALALGALTEEGIVHRDVKPGNLLLTKTGRVKLADFGLAKPSEVSLSLTRTDAVVGTPAYIAPEQWDREQDHRSDLYSLGCTLYELLVGDPPFDGQEPEVYFQQHLHDVPIDLRAILPDVSPQMAKIVRKLLEKDPKSRFQTGFELAEALAPLAEGARLSGAIDPYVSPPAERPKPTPAPKPQRVAAKRRTTPERAGLPWLYLLGLAIATLGGFVLRSILG